VEFFRRAQDFIRPDADLLGKFFPPLRGSWAKLVERWIERTDRYLEPLHLAEQAFEVVLLEGQEFGQRLAAGFDVLGQESFPA